MCTLVCRVWIILVDATPKLGVSKEVMWYQSNRLDHRIDHIGFNTKQRYGEMKYGIGMRKY